MSGILALKYCFQLYHGHGKDHQLHLNHEAELRLPQRHLLRLPQRYRSQQALLTGIHLHQWALRLGACFGVINPTGP